MRKLIIYGIPILGVLASFIIIHVMVRPITLTFLGYMAILAIIAWTMGYALDRWRTKP